jgi:hypothetical protein
MNILICTYMSATFGLKHFKISGRNGDTLNRHQDGGHGAGDGAVGAAVVAAREKQL